MEKIGLIAGNRKFPLLFAQGAKKRNVSVVACAIKGETSRSLAKLVGKIYWLSLSEYRRLPQIFKSENIDKVVMAGQISPRRLFSREVAANQDIQALLNRIKDKKADTIFGAIVQDLGTQGLVFLDSTTFVEEYLPGKGVLTLRKPDDKLLEDINFGVKLAKAVGDLDIGQTVAVKDKAIVGVEAFEGTDNLIRRAGRLLKGITVVKVSKPKQDKRFDVPVVGLKTIRSLVSVGAKCLAIEAGSTLFIDQEASIKLADKKGLCIVSV